MFTQLEFQDRVTKLPFVSYMRVCGWKSVIREIRNFTTHVKNNKECISIDLK